MNFISHLLSILLLCTTFQLAVCHNFVTLKYSCILSQPVAVVTLSSCPLLYKGLCYAFLL